MKTIHRILWDLESRKNLNTLKVEELYLRSYFSVVGLSDGSVGSAGNFDIQFNYENKIPYNPPQLEKRLLAKTNDDPLLLNSLWDSKDGVGRSLLVAIASALSQDLLTSSYLEKRNMGLRRGRSFEKISGWEGFVSSLLQEEDTITVIGYGGVLFSLLKSKKPERIYVSDLNFNYESFLDKKTRDLKAKLKKGNFRGDLKLSDGSDNQDLIADSDVLFITGSALCNDTMTDLLLNSQGCRNVVVQGPSASVFPKALFDSNVDYVLTNLKSKQELVLGRYYGEKILDVVDDNLIVLYRK